MFYYPLQAAATKEEAINQMNPDIEAMASAIDSFKNATSGADVIKSAEEYNSLLQNYREKWSSTDYRIDAYNQLAFYSDYDIDWAVSIPSYIYNLKSAFLDGVNAGEYGSFTMFYNTDLNKAYILCNKDNIKDSCIVSTNGVFIPNFSTMDGEPDRYIAFKDNTVYFPYADFGNHDFVNWAFDMSGSGSGVGNSEELEYDGMRDITTDTLDEAIKEVMKYYMNFDNEWNK